MRRAASAPVVRLALCGCESGGYRIAPRRLSPRCEIASAPRRRVAITRSSTVDALVPRGVWRCLRGRRVSSLQMAAAVLPGPRLGHLKGGPTLPPEEPSPTVGVLGSRSLFVHLLLLHFQRFGRLFKIDCI
ncbi:hypothetical protein HPB50_021913 [Hyalomma asiaticum]|uniref:Uncharacterized protein n=1 Tax=Hyalomma asiaticum TaxID=266040 RepID=A0ACB7T0M7_HYAAI|nr:hypothetical protein HPB50_021913 [Hyalomma asiaticum]